MSANVCVYQCMCVRERERERERKKRKRERRRERNVCECARKMDIKIWCVRAFVSGWMRESVSLRVRECVCIEERERQTESLKKKACERMQG